MENSLYIVEVLEDDQKYQYEYSNLKHAEEHYSNEISAAIYEYNNGNYYFVKVK